MMIITQGEQDYAVCFTHVREEVPKKPRPGRPVRADDGASELLDHTIVATKCIIKSGPKGTKPSEMTTVIEESSYIARDKKLGFLKDMPSRERGRRISMGKALQHAFPRYGSTSKDALQLREEFWKSYFAAQGALDPSGNYVGKGKGYKVEAGEKEPTSKPPES